MYPQFILHLVCDLCIKLSRSDANLVFSGAPTPGYYTYDVVRCRFVVPSHDDDYQTKVFFALKIPFALTSLCYFFFFFFFSS